MKRKHQKPLREQLEDLRRKADQQVTMHAVLRDRNKFLNSLFTTVSLVSSVFLLAIIMATPEYAERTLKIPRDYYQWFMAAVAASSFSVVVVLLAWRPDVKATLHDQAVRHYTQSASRAARLGERDEPPTEGEVRAVREAYLEDRDLPRIPEKKFLPLKQWHLQKVAASKELSKNPSQSLKALRKRLARAYETRPREPRGDRDEGRP